MCGVHGFCWRDDAGDAARMLGAAAHRGPDGSGAWGDGRVTLAHNLLALTAEPAAAAQPWHHAGTVLAFNGEVYNHADLRKTLRHECRTDSDTEVLAAGLAEQGVDFLRRVDGMFALAFYDPARAELVLARDTNGARPLYYGTLNGRLAFSSEVRSLLALGFDRKVSRDGFRHYYHAGLVAGPLTLFDGVCRLVPGEVVRYNVATEALTSTNLNEAPPRYEGPADALPGLLAERLGQAVRLTLGGRRVAGLLLSGGMDSSSVLHEAVAGGVRPLTFTTRFALPHPKCDHNEDANVAAQLARVYKTRHREVAVTEQQWVDDLAGAVAAMEEPRQGKSFPAYYATMRAVAAGGAVVVLTGDGGDELLNGYKHQRPAPFRERLEALRLGHRGLPDPALAMTVDEQAAYLDWWLPRGGLTGDPLNDFMYTESMHTLSEDFLVREDKLGMAFGLEARFPFLCRVVRDFVRGVPGDLKLAPPGTLARIAVGGKSLLRRAYAKRLPRQVLAKEKTGWRAPTDEWVVGRPGHPAVDGPLRQYLRAVLGRPEIATLFGVTPADVEGRFLNNRDFFGPPKPSGRPSVGPGLASQKELFTAAMFAAWLDAFKMRLW